MSWLDREVYKDDQKLAAALHKGYQDSYKALSPLRDIWKRTALYLRNKHDLSMFEGGTGKYPYDSQVFIPTFWEQAETATPRVAAGVLSNDVLVRFKPLLEDGELNSLSEYVVWARANQALHNAQLEEDVEIRSELLPWLRDAVPYGTKWLFVEWFTRSAPDLKLNRVKGEDRWEFGVEAEEVNGEKRPRTRIIEDRLKVTGLSIFDVFPDPKGLTRSNPRDCRYIQRVVPAVTIDELWSWIQATPKKGWKVKSRNELKAICGKIIGEQDHEQVQVRTDRLDAEYGSGYRPGGEGDKRLIWLLDHWEDEYHILMAGAGANPENRQQPTGESEGGWKIILVEEREQHPYRLVGKPFVAVRPVRIDNQLYGIGLGEVIADLTHTTNTLVNMRLANLNRSINNLTICNNAAGVYARQILSQPGGAIDTIGNVDLENCVKFIPWPDVTQQAFEETNFVGQHIQLAGGGSDFAQGQATSGFNETVRGIQYLLEQGNVRYNLMVHSVGQDMRQLVRTMMDVNRQYITKPRLVRIVGADGAEEYESVLPSMLNRRYSIFFDTRPQAANTALQSQQLINTLAVIRDRPENNWPEILKEVWRLSGVVDPFRFINQMSSDAHHENAIFTQTGTMPAVRLTDNDIHHIKVHQELWGTPAMQRHGPEGVRQVDVHMQQHFEKGGLLRPSTPAGAPAGGPEGAMGPPRPQQFQGGELQPFQSSVPPSVGATPGASGLQPAGL